ncbi:MAG: hypothetical protein NTZ68_04255 [Candidatus Dependentiae bacterium]|nr:hypothetical protein [Candidatus Dependentiae bacterium]
MLQPQEKIRLLLFQLDQAFKAKTDRLFGSKIVNIVLPLLRYVFPDLATEQKLWNGLDSLDKSSAYYKTKFFGGNFGYCEHQEYPLLYLRHRSGDKPSRASDDIRILYEYLCEFEIAWQRKRDYFREKILFHQPSDHLRRKHRNKTKEKLTQQDKMRDLQCLNEFMDHAEIKAMKTGLNASLGKNSITMRRQLSKQEQDCYDAAFFKNMNVSDTSITMVDDSAHVDISSVQNWIYTRKKITNYIKAIICAYDESFLHVSDKQFEPLRVQSYMKEGDKKLLLIVEWLPGIKEHLILWEKTKKGSVCTLLFAQNLMSVGSGTNIKKKPRGYCSAKYLKRLGITAILEKIFKIDKRASIPRVKNKEEAVSFAELRKEDRSDLLAYIKTLKFDDLEF